MHASTEKKNDHGTRFYLQTDIVKMKIPLFVVPYVHSSNGVQLMPSTIFEVNQIHTGLNTDPEENTFFTIIRRSPSPTDLRKIIKMFKEREFSVIVLACDCAERCEIVLNTIISVFGQQSLSTDPH